MHLPSLLSQSTLVKAATCVFASFVALGAQALSAETVPTGSTTVAYVYVSYTPAASSSNKIAGFAAAANGTLTTLPGSPYLANVGSMAVNRAYLFGSNMTGNWVSSFSIHSNGSLHWVNSTNVQTPDPTGCVYPTDITLDHSGSTLYRVQFSGGLCDYTHYQSFMIDKLTGKLTFLGKSADIFLFNSPLSFSGSNKFAYGSQCLNYEGFPLDTFTGYVRQSGGLLNVASISAPDPATQDSTHFYCRAWTAADPTSHLAVTFTDTDFNNPYSSPATQLGVYTIQSTGNLTTTSTWSNMPATEVGFTTGLAMSRDGKLLAVSGTGGLQVFFFNGANPITPFTGFLTTDRIDQATWDHNHHLYALSRAAGKLYVFTIAGGFVTPAPGSPYALTAPADLIVQPLTDSDGDWDHD
jgi:6-phosphogluconolactonase (cycloisomerase 2 family)